MILDEADAVRAWLYECICISIIRDARTFLCGLCVPVHQYAASQLERKKKNQLCIYSGEELDREDEQGKNGEQGQQEI